MCLYLFYAHDLLVGIGNICSGFDHKSIGNAYSFVECEFKSVFITCKLSLAPSSPTRTFKHKQIHKPQPFPSTFFSRHSRQHISAGGPQKGDTMASSTMHHTAMETEDNTATSPDRLRGATNDLFELLERVQCSRLDDQRCVLPAYFAAKVSER